MSDFEAELIHHAAPTLLGRKQSNLFSLPLSLLPKCKEEIALYGKKLAEKGICIVYLYSFKNRVFIIAPRIAIQHVDENGIGDTHAGFDK